MTRSGPDSSESPDPIELFNPVTLNRASQAIVDQIRELLLSGRLRPGERLPTERGLCERFGVSRVTVREALRILEAAGLVAIRVGARGGAYVTAPSRDLVGRDIEDYLWLSPSVSAAEVTETRLVLELGIVPMVCARATDEDIAALFEFCDVADATMACGDYTMEMSAEFHVRVARVAHNSAIEMLLRPFHGPMLRSLRQARNAAPTMGAHGVVEHRRFVEAVRDRDLDRATDVMRAHLERTASRVRP
jgi:DNA-binding FadR family transcriptional regulator